jgi:hypothetical protein
MFMYVRVSMYVCMYVFMYVYMYVYTYVCMYVCRCLYVFWRQNVYSQKKRLLHSYTYNTCKKHLHTSNTRIQLPTLPHIHAHTHYLWNGSRCRQKEASIGQKWRRNDYWRQNAHVDCCGYEPACSLGIVLYVYVSYILVLFHVCIMYIRTYISP